ncbi:hypothetical protein SUDANB37_01430 [Streptomyces sp. enrichment culture]
MGGAGARGVEGAFRVVYAEAFAGAPHNEGADDVAATFRRFRSLTRKGTFRAVLGRADDGEPVGMAYGYCLAADVVWWDQFVTPVADDMRREDGRRTFGLIELAVRPSWRRRGVARILHRTCSTASTLNGCCSTSTPRAPRPRPPTVRGGTARWARRFRGRALISMT